MQILHLSFLLIGAYFSVLILTAYVKAGRFLQQASKKIHEVNAKPRSVELNKDTTPTKQRVVKWLKAKLDEFE